MKDTVLSHYPCEPEYSYSLAPDNLTPSNKLKIRHRREKGRPRMFILFRLHWIFYVIFMYFTDYSDSDSDEWSSIERREPLYNSSNDTFSKLSRRSATQKRSKRKRTAIPVPTPKVPSLNQSSNGSNMNFNSLSGQLGKLYSKNNNEIKK